MSKEDFKEVPPPERVSVLVVDLLRLQADSAMLAALEQAKVRD